MHAHVVAAVTALTPVVRWSGRTLRWRRGRSAQVSSAPRRRTRTTMSSSTPPLRACPWLASACRASRRARRRRRAFASSRACGPARPAPAAVRERTRAFFANRAQARARPSPRAPAAMRGAPEARPRHGGTLSLELMCPAGNVDYNANWPSGIPAGTTASGAFCQPGWTGSISRQCLITGQWAATAVGGCTRTSCCGHRASSVGRPAPRSCGCARPRRSWRACVAPVAAPHPPQRCSASRPALARPTASRRGPSRPRRRCRST